MADETNTPSRRAMLAELAASPMAGLAFAAEAEPSPLSLAIAHHKAVRAVITSGNVVDDDHMAELCHDEFVAVEAIARLPCSSEAELLRKLRHLFDFELTC